MCRICAETRDHRANGRCSPCDQFWRDNGWDKPPHFALAWGYWDDPCWRFMRYVRHVGHCWEWTGSTWNGYGRFQVDGGMVIAHRWIYERVVGPIPDGHQIDHLCRNTLCVFPGHHEAVTPAENTARGMRARQTHCKWGHPLEGENLRVSLDKKTGRKRRVCRACRRDAKRRYEERQAST